MTCWGCDAALTLQNCRPATLRRGRGRCKICQAACEKRKRKSYGAGNRSFREPPRDPNEPKEVFRLSYNDIMGQRGSAGEVAQQWTSNRYRRS